MVSVELSDREYAKENLKLLQDMDILPNYMFKMCYEYFMDIVNFDYLNNEEKTKMAYYLSQIDISFDDCELDDYNSMKYELFNYYSNNIKNCSSNVVEDISSYDLNLRKKRSLRKKDNQEEFVRINCPLVYEELMRLREENEVMRKVMIKNNK